jgi:hypothetical protein
MSGTVDVDLGAARGDGAVLAAAAANEEGGTNGQFSIVSPVLLKDWMALCCDWTCATRASTGLATDLVSRG